MNTIRTVGVIGLGVMGGRMAATLARKGFRVIGCDTRAERLDAAVSQGIEPMETASAAFRKAEVTVLSLPTEDVLEQVILGREGLLESAVAGKVIIDTTTTTVRMAQTLAARLAERGTDFLDSPVTGGSGGAENGSLSIMVGGDAGAFERHRDVFEALGSTVVRIGPSGHGQMAKMVNQMLMAAIYTSVSEAFSFAAAMGADIGKIYEVVGQGGGRSGLLGGMRANMLAGRTSRNGNLAQHGKDIDYVMREANERKAFLPVTASVHEVYNLARSMGLGEIWSGEMWAVWERLCGLRPGQPQPEAGPGDPDPAAANQT